MYTTCTCTPHVHHMYMYTTCTCTPHVHVQSCTCTCTFVDKQRDYFLCCSILVGEGHWAIVHKHSALCTMYVVCSTQSHSDIVHLPHLKIQQTHTHIFTPCTRCTTELCRAIVHTTHHKHMIQPHTNNKRV